MTWNLGALTMAEERDKRKLGGGGGGVDRRPQPRPKRVLVDSSRHFDPWMNQARGFGENELEEDDTISLDNLRSRTTVLRTVHAQLRQTLSKADKLHTEKLVQEFENARSHEGSDLPDSAWTDALLEALLEQAHENEHGNSPGRTLYHMGQKTIFLLSGGRVGIQFDPTYLGEPQESYFCVLSSKQPPAEKIYMSKHNLPSVIPVRDLERLYLSTSAAKFIDKIGEHLQGYVGRRSQMMKLQQLHGHMIEDFYHTRPYDSISFSVQESNTKVEVSVAYDKRELDRPTRSAVTAWFVYPEPSSRRTAARRGTRPYQVPQVAPRSLHKPAQVIMSKAFPEAFDDLVREIREALAEEANRSPVIFKDSDY